MSGSSPVFPPPFIRIGVSVHVPLESSGPPPALAPPSTRLRSHEAPDVRVAWRRATPLESGERVALKGVYSSPLDVLSTTVCASVCGERTTRWGSGATKYTTIVTPLAGFRQSGSFQSSPRGLLREDTVRHLLLTLDGPLPTPPVSPVPVPSLDVSWALGTAVVSGASVHPFTPDHPSPPSLTSTLRRPVEVPRQV